MRPSRRLSLPLMKLTCYSLSRARERPPTYGRIGRGQAVLGPRAEPPASRPWLRLPPGPVLSGLAPFGNSLPRCPPPGLGLGDVLQGPGPPALPEGLRLLLLLLALPTVKPGRPLPMVSCPLVEVCH